MCYRCDQAREDCIGIIRETARAFMRAKASGASARLVAQWAEALRELADSYRSMHLDFLLARGEAIAFNRPVPSSPGAVR